MSNKQYYHADYAGSIIAVSGTDGGPIDVRAYGPYGETDYVDGNVFLYTGRRLDPETGLYCYRARYYSPSIGRFLQTDPIGYGDNMNMYAYVGNDPINAKDPTGEFAWIAVAAFVGAAIDVAVTVTSQVAEHGEINDWGDVGVAAARGAATGVASSVGAGGAAFIAANGAKLGKMGQAIAGTVGATATEATIAANHDGAQGADAAVNAAAQTGSGLAQGVVKAYGDALKQMPGKIGKITRALTSAGENVQAAAGAAADGLTDVVAEALGQAGAAVAEPDTQKDR